jgi:hypothetical protein
MVKETDLVAVLITETELSPKLLTYTSVPLGVIPMPLGHLPTGIAETALFFVRSTGVTEPIGFAGSAQDVATGETSAT